MFFRMNRIIERANEIDFLRGLAALLVVMMHAKGMLWIGISETWLKYGATFNINAWLGYATAPLMFGYLGVSLFFVLSGYCIHYRGAHDLVENNNAKLNIKAFLLRRFVRIYPLYVTVLCLTYLIDSIDLTKQIIELDESQDRSLFVFLVNLLFLQGLLGPTFGSNGVLWTLSIEFHLYIAYPFLFYMSQRFGAKFTMIFTLFVSLIYIFIDQKFGIRSSLPSENGIGPIFLSYWFTFAMGFYLAEVKAGREYLTDWFYRISWLSIILLFTILIFGNFFNKQIVNTFFYEAATTICSTLAFGGLLKWTTSSFNVNMLNNIAGMTLAKVGVYSYSLYAIHVPILIIVKSIITTTGISTNTLLPSVIGLVASLVAAKLCFFVVEQWSMKDQV